MSEVSRRSFLEKAGVTLAAGTIPIEANAVARKAKESTEARSQTIEDPTRNGIARCVVEWSYYSGKAYADPFNDVELDVVFIDPEGHEETVPAFWAGEQTWRIRYSPMTAGHYTYRTIASDSASKELHDRHGKLEVTDYQGVNPLRKHGPIHVAADQRHFEHTDKSHFFWLGDTWWMGLCSRLRWPEDFQELAADRAQKGFTVIQIVAGLYPDMPPFDPRGANEAGYPWEADYSRINPAYFDAADLRIQHLVEVGLSPCIVGCWGYFLPMMGVPKIKKHWRNLVARWAAYPVIWCLAGEGAMPFYLSKTGTEDAAAQKQGWTEVAKYVRSIDPYHHVITIHPTDNARNQVEDPSVLDVDMLQTGSSMPSIPRTVNGIVESLLKEPRMPVVDGEVVYEGMLGGAVGQDLERFAFWTCILNGAGGHTYGANGIWQVNQEEKPFGPSPSGLCWGNTPWNVAAELPGSKQVGLGKKFLSKYEWWRLEPHPEWMDPHWSKDAYQQAYAAGIPGQLRLFYMPPSRKPPKVVNLEAAVAYRAFFFDPAMGQEHEVGDVTPDSNGAWPVPITPTYADYVLVLEKKS
jgi:hypothetical protein